MYNGLMNNGSTILYIYIHMCVFKLAVSTFNKILIAREYFFRDANNVEIFLNQ